jgi:RNA-directed DNA polymerase
LPTPLREPSNQVLCDVFKSFANSNYFTASSGALTGGVVQTAAKLVLEPIFEVDFDPNAYGYRPKRSAQDSVAKSG